MKRVLILLAFLLVASQGIAQNYNQPAGVFGQTINRLRVNHTIILAGILTDTLVHSPQDSLWSFKWCTQDNTLRIWNGSTWLRCSPISSGGGGGGITSINGDATAAQTLTIDSTGTDFNITNPGSGSHKWNIPTSTNTKRGLLSANDHIIFNSKIGGISVPSANGFQGTFTGSPSSVGTFSVTAAPGSLLKSSPTYGLMAAVAGTDFVASESDPIFLSSSAFGIGLADISHWDQAYNKYLVSGAYSAGTITLTTRDGNTWNITGIPHTLASADYANQGTTTSVLHGNASGNPSFGQIVNGDIANGTIDLTSKVTGILPAANLPSTYRYSGSTSGNVVIQAPATVTSYSVTLPPAVGVAGQTIMLSDNVGTAYWGTPSGGTTVTSGNTNQLVITGTTSYTLTPQGTTTPTAAKPMIYGTNTESYSTNFVYTTVSTATSTGTLTLTASSGQGQNFTGSANHAVYMPVTSTLTTNHRWYFSNYSTGTISIYSSGGNIIYTLYSGQCAMLQCQATGGTSASDWNVGYIPAFAEASTPNTAVLRDFTGRANVDTLVGTGNITYTLPANVNMVFISIKPTTTSNYSGGTTGGGTQVFPSTSFTGGVFTTVSVLKEYGPLPTTIYLSNSGGGSTVYKIAKQ